MQSKFLDELRIRLTEKGLNAKEVAEKLAPYETAIKQLRTKSYSDSKIEEILPKPEKIVEENLDFDKDISKFILRAEKDAKIPEDRKVKVEEKVIVSENNEMKNIESAGFKAGMESTASMDKKAENISKEIIVDTEEVHRSIADEKPISFVKTPNDPIIDRERVVTKPQTQDEVIRTEQQNINRVDAKKSQIDYEKEYRSRVTKETAHDDSDVIVKEIKYADKTPREVEEVKPEKEKSNFGLILLLLLFAIIDVIVVIPLILIGIGALLFVLFLPIASVALAIGALLYGGEIYINNIPYTFHALTYIPLSIGIVLASIFVLALWFYLVKWFFKFVVGIFNMQSRALRKVR